MRKMIVVEEAKDITLLTLNTSNQWVPVVPKNPAGPIIKLVNSSFRIGSKIFIKIFAKFATNTAINTFTSKYRVGFITEGNYIDLDEFNQNATKYPSIINIQGGINSVSYNSEWVSHSNTDGTMSIVNNWTEGNAGSTNYLSLYITGFMEDPTWVKTYKYHYKAGNEGAGWEVGGPLMMTNENTGETINFGNNTNTINEYNNQALRQLSPGKWVMPYTGTDYDTWGISFTAYDVAGTELYTATATYDTVKKQYEIVINYGDYSNYDKITEIVFIAE